MAALRYAPHVPLDDNDEHAYGASCVMLNLSGHRFNVVKFHWVVVLPLAQVHLVMVPGQRG